MTKKEWEILLEILDGKQFNPLPTGFIIDSPWLPGWYGVSALDYYSNDSLWLKANFNAIDLPIPLEAPVIIHTLPTNEFIYSTNIKNLLHIL